MKYILDYNTFLLEGYDDSLSFGIKQKDVPTIKEDIVGTLLPLLLLNDSDLFFAGSSGKKKDPEELSKNINVVIDLNSFIKSNNLENNHIQFFKDQIKRLKYNTTLLDDDSLSIDWPFNDSNVETIVNFNDNLDWVRFTRHCPDLCNNESEYVNKYRESLFSAIVESINKKIVSYDDENDNIREYSTLIFDKNYGLFRIIKSFIGANGILTKAHEVKGSKKLITSNPDKFVNILFGDKYTKDQLMTFENVSEAIKDQDFKFYNKLEQIKSRFYKKIINLNLPQITL